MQPAQIANSYDSIAHQWLEPFLETNGIHQHEHALQFRPHGGIALDVGSGCSGRFIRLLEANGYQVEGLDLSPQMIALTKTRNLKIRFHHADVCDWIPPHQYDFITAWDSIWHVPLDRNAAVLQKLCSALNPGGVFIWTTGGLDAPEEKRDSSLGPPLYYSTLGIPKTLQTISEAGCLCASTWNTTNGPKNMSSLSHKSLKTNGKHGPSERLSFGTQGYIRSRLTQPKNSDAQATTSCSSRAVPRPDSPQLQSVKLTTKASKAPESYC